MTHIAMVPADRYFTSEHMTLVWMGNANQMEKERAEHIVRLINRYISDTNADDTLESMDFCVFGTVDNPYRNFNGTVVACGKVSGPVEHFRKTAIMVGLNSSDYAWQPHITGEQQLWREPGERVRFIHAELR